MIGPKSHLLYRPLAFFKLRNFFPWPMQLVICILKNSIYEKSLRFQESNFLPVFSEARCNYPYFSIFFLITDLRILGTVSGLTCKIIKCLCHQYFPWKLYPEVYLTTLSKIFDEAFFPKEVNPFHVTDLFWYPLKTPENQTLSDVFKG